MFVHVWVVTKFYAGSFKTLFMFMFFGLLAVMDLLNLINGSDLGSWANKKGLQSING